MKIVALNASPRLNGNCRTALEKVIEYAQNNDAEVEIIDLNIANIKPCQSCNYCKAHAGLCMIDDDMQEIHKKIIESDAFILAAPIYFSQMNAQANMFINRLYSFFQTEMLQQEGESYIVTISNIYDYDIKDSEKLKKIRAGIIVTQGLENIHEYDSYLASGVLAQIDLLFDLKDVVVLNDTNVPGIIEQRPEQLDKIKVLTEKLIE